VAVTVQEPLAGIRPSAVTPTLEVSTINHPFRNGVSIQVVRTLPATTTRPLGSVSINGPVRLAGVSFVLLKVMVRVEDPPAWMVAGLKVLVIVGRLEVAGIWHVGMVMVLESSVTAPFRARALPDTLAPVARVMLVSARILPANEVPVPRVAELPICQNTLHG